MTKTAWYSLPLSSRCAWFSLESPVKITDEKFLKSRHLPKDKVFTIAQIIRTNNTARLYGVTGYLSLTKLEPADLELDNVLPTLNKIADELTASFKLPRQTAIEKYAKLYDQYQKTVVSPWTEGELALATDYSRKFLFQLFSDKVYSYFPDVYQFPAEGKTELSIDDTVCYQALASGDQFNEKIGLCVCLAKATHNPIPDFILNKNKRG